MGKIKRVLTIPAALAVLAVMYLVVRIGASAMQGYSWQEMDWQQRGTTSIADFFKASDIGKRDVAKAGKDCVEYYAYKDGLPVKTVCPR
ncbi:hypothetical protein [Ramlibacter albus]|uniref:Uncharacterized protein n=1 Tax=Ramlibacter albus TaxID=2079448 RepID=A0A923M6Z1_9BURK|nr:hypothetical protein [Ramlibacter albus]MBC5765120.1 hypothetical protein [Ramlibacter albus]